MPAMLEADAANERILKEYIEGETIFDLVIHERMRPEYYEQIKAMCALLYLFSPCRCAHACHNSNTFINFAE